MKTSPKNRNKQSLFFDQLEDKLRQPRQRKRFPVSGKSVFNLASVIRNKNKKRI